MSKKATLLRETVLSNLLEHGIELKPNRVYSKEFTFEDIELEIQYNFSRIKSTKAINEVDNAFNFRIKKAINMIRDIKNLYPNATNQMIQRAWYSTRLTASIPNIKAEIKNTLDTLLIEQVVKQYENVQDYPDVFPHARNRKRKIIAYLGETNSGKTFNAMSEIANVSQSIYLAPLRLLALETYDYLNKNGIVTNLITGEEKIEHDDAQCVASTVECFNPNNKVDLVVIDEVQMMDDPDRGAFFIQALVGSNADTIVVTAPPEYKDRLAHIAHILGDEIEIHIFKRKTKIEVLEPISLNDVKPNTAIIAFSRKKIFEIRDSLPKHIKSSVIYGALGHEVRKKQAEQFVSGETDVIIATDAIGMGLNLPVETVLFTSDKKYNGKKVDKVSHMLTKQIAGRAGRYKKFDVGYVTGTDENILEHIKQNISKDLEVDTNAKFGVRPTNDYIEKLMQKHKLSAVLKIWSDLKYPEGSNFYNIKLDDQVNIASYLEKKYPNDVHEFYKLIYCPIDLSKDDFIFKYLTDCLIRFGVINVPYIDDKLSIDQLEVVIKNLSITLWFANQFPDKCNGGYSSFVEQVHEHMSDLNDLLHSKLTAYKKKKKNGIRSKV